MNRGRPIRFLLNLGLLCAVLFLGPSDSMAGPGAAQVHLRIAGLAFSVGDPIEIQVVNETDAPVFVAGCGSIQVEVLVDEDYEPLPPVHCAEEGKARALPVGQSTLPFAAPAGLAGQTGRALLVFGVGCTPDRSLSRGRCSDFRTVWSGNFRVKPVDG